jgi:hypothetical protein
MRKWEFFNCGFQIPDWKGGGQIKEVGSGNAEVGKNWHSVKVEDRRQKTEDRCQRKEDRRKKWEVGKNDCGKQIVKGGR